MEGLYKVDRAQNGGIRCNGRLVLRAGLKAGRGGNGERRLWHLPGLPLLLTPKSVKRHQREET
jgi:hypothetical protein